MSNKSRARKGRFAVGNSGGPGNPFVRRLAAYRTMIAEAPGPEEVKRRIREIYEKAIAGDVAAAKAVLEAYLDAAAHCGRCRGPFAAVDDGRAVVGDRLLPLVTGDRPFAAVDDGRPVMGDRLRPLVTADRAPFAAVGDGRAAVRDRLRPLVTGGPGAV